MLPINMDGPVLLAHLVLEAAVERICATKKDQTGITLLEKKKQMKLNGSSHKSMTPTFGQEQTIVTEMKS